MKTLVFSKRNLKELFRDPLSLSMSLGFPLLILGIVAIVQASVPVPVFSMQNFFPGVLIFGYTFITLFTADLVAKDRSTSFLTRMFASPLKSYNYILGYSLPLLPLAVVQCVICTLVAFALDLVLSWNILILFLVLLPIQIMSVGLGILLGTILTDKQCAPICSILVNVCAILSGMWFDLDAVGGAVKFIAYLLPYAHAFKAGTCVLNGNFDGIWINVLVTTAYMILFYVLAIVLFRKKMKSDNK